MVVCCARLASNVKGVACKEWFQYTELLLFVADGNAAAADLAVRLVERLLFCSVLFLCVFCR